ncbi:MAG: NADH-quinone oxidoreductase subunit NuoE [Anaerolineales bacterium]|jgi:NADH:ubiquinone oxidoreductase subunit E
MVTETQNKQAVMNAVEAAIKEHGTSREELIPILNDINRKIGYLPQEALEEVSRRLRLAKSQVFAVTTFYRMLSTKPRGRHVIQFCESAPCHVVGGREVWETLQDILKISEDETTPDGKWSLVTTSCLGICGVGPVIVIDDDIYGNVTPEQIPDILARYS